MKKIASLFAATLVLIAANVCWGQNFWEPANGPLYGSVICIAFDSAGAIFAGTDHGGIFRSRDNGESWTNVSAGLLDNYKFPSGLTIPYGVYSIAASHDGQIYASSNGLFRSTDEGASWAKIDTTVYTDLLVTPSNKLFGLKAVSNLWNGGVGLLNESNHAWTTVLQGTCNYLTLGPSGRLFVVNSGMLYSTIDNGVSWRADTEGQFSYGPRGIHDTVVVRFSNFTPGNILFDSAGRLFTGNLIFDTVTRTWSKYYLSSYYTYIYDRTGRFMDHLGYLFVTTDQGRTWLSTDSLVDSLYATLLTFAPSGELYAVNYCQGLERSTSGGNWINVQHGITGLTSLNSIVLTPKGNLVIGTKSFLFLYRSSNSGNTWITNGPALDLVNESGAIAVSPGGRLLRGTDAGIYVSSNEGDSWRYADSTMGYIASIASTPGGTIFASTGQEGVFLSSDDGNTWIPTVQEPADSSLNNVLTTKNDEVFVGSSHGLFRTSDQGTSWTRVMIDSGFIFPLIETGSGKLLASTWHGYLTYDSLFSSTDNGQSWMHADSGLSCKYIGKCIVNPEGELFLSTDSGVFTSTNDGISWIPLDTGLAKVLAVDLVCDSNGRIFAVDPNKGIFRSIHSTLAVSELNNLPSLVISLSQNSPNPFPQSTTISFTLPAPSFISLALYDATGREVAALANGFFAAGEHEVPFARGTLPAGIYFYRLETNGSAQTRAMGIEP